MRRPLLLAIAFAAILAGGLSAHDMFLRLENYFVAPHAPLSAPLLNGTFSTSANAITRARFADLSLVGPSGRQRIDTTAVSAAHDTTLISTQIGPTGTYVLAAATLPNSLRMSGRQFAAYLREEGLGNVLAARRAAGQAGDSTSETYSKHVKTVFQAGATLTDDYQTSLGYAAELIPLTNPYALRVGGRLRLRLLVHGAPAAGLTLLAGGRDGHGRRLPQQTITSDREGIATMRVPARGTYYAKFISMRRQEGGATEYESLWATLTFAVR